MITNFTLASVASTVFQAQAAQAARESLRAQRAASTPLDSETIELQRSRQRLESQKLLDRAGPKSFSDITAPAQSLALSSVAFLQTFGGNTAAFADEEESLGDDSSRQRGYSAYQQFSEILNALKDIANENTEDGTLNVSDFAALLPRELRQDAELPEEPTPFAPQFSDSISGMQDELDPDAPPYFQLSYGAFSKAMDFRNQAFAFPPTLNLIG